MENPNYKILVPLSCEYQNDNIRQNHVKSAMFCIAESQRQFLQNVCVKICDISY